MVRPRTLVLLSVALELEPRLRAGARRVVRLHKRAAPDHVDRRSSGSSGSGASSGSTSGEDSGSGSGSGAVSASGTTTGNMSTLDMGLVPDFDPPPIGCQGKIDFLFVISSSHFDMKE
jgi:hypothetical protein